MFVINSLVLRGLSGLRGPVVLCLAKVALNFDSGCASMVCQEMSGA